MGGWSTWPTDGERGKRLFFPFFFFSAVAATVVVVVVSFSASTQGKCFPSSTLFFPHLILIYIANTHCFFLLLH